jgi:hypothetical protein
MIKTEGYTVDGMFIGYDKIKTILNKRKSFC